MAAFIIVGVLCGLLASELSCSGHFFHLPAYVQEGRAFCLKNKKNLGGKKKEEPICPPLILTTRAVLGRAFACGGGEEGKLRKVTRTIG